MTVETLHSDLRSAAREKLLTVENLPTMHWEGRNFTPIKGQAYVSESFRAITSTVQALGLGGVIAHTCTANFTIHYPSDTGTTDIDALAGAMLNTFRPGTSLAYGDSTATITQAERGPLLQEPDWLNCTVIISMTARTLN